MACPEKANPEAWKSSVCLELAVTFTQSREHRNTTKPYNVRVNSMA